MYRREVGQLLSLEMLFNLLDTKLFRGGVPLGLTGLMSLQSGGTLKSLQHHSSKASILWCLAFFMVQISHAYMTTGKNIALTIWTFVGKVMSLFLNMLSRFVIVSFQGARIF